MLVVDVAAHRSSNDGIRLGALARAASDAIPLTLHFLFTSQQCAGPLCRIAHHDHDNHVRLLVLVLSSVVPGWAVPGFFWKTRVRTFPMRTRTSMEPTVTKAKSGKKDQEQTDEPLPHSVTTNDSRQSCRHKNTKTKQKNKTMLMMTSAATRLCRPTMPPLLLRRRLVTTALGDPARRPPIAPTATTSTRRMAGTLTMPTTPMTTRTRWTDGTKLAAGTTMVKQHHPWWAATTTVAALVGIGLLQYQYGHQRDFFEYRFIINDDNDDDQHHKIDPDDLAAFYGGEEFMELFCVMPFMGTLMMRGGHFDEEGTVHTTGFPGTMQVSMVFSDEMDADDGQTKWFNKRERFRDVLFGSYTCWDMVTNFGFTRLDDGRIMVYHHGEYFTGRFPPFSLFARFIFGLHARWVAWATEHYLHHYAFRGSSSADDDDDRDDEEVQLEEQARADMPLFLLTHYAPSDLMNLLFGRQTAATKPSFLLRRKADDAKAREAMDDTLTKLLPVYSPRIQRHITLDIQQDRVNAKSALVVRRQTTTRLAHRDSTGREETPPVGDSEAQQIPLRLGLRRTVTLTRHMTRRLTTNLNTDAAGDDIDDDNMDDLDDDLMLGLGRQHKGGSAAWESVRATNDPQAYQAVTYAARERQLQRKATLAGRPTTDHDDDTSSTNVAAAVDHHHHVTDDDGRGPLSN
jgi:hypothetical protein